jgi:hypothetical protein
VFIDIAIPLVVDIPDIPLDIIEVVVVVVVAAAGGLEPPHPARSAAVPAPRAIAKRVITVSSSPHSAGATLDRE